jgi:hypothetical protein
LTPRPSGPTLGEADKEAVKLVMTNGDTLQGVLSLETLVMNTLLGEMRIGMPHVTRLTIVLEPAKPAADQPAKE